MFVGIVLRMSDMMTLENANTAITEIPITIAGSSLAVTARHEQIPSICTITGLSFEKGLKSTFLFFIFSALVTLVFI